MATREHDSTSARQLVWAWRQQRIWSRSASQLKRRIDHARVTALLLAIATAVFAVAADQVGGLSVGIGRGLSACAAVSAGFATVLQRRVSTDQIRDWTRARSASEGLKTEIYSYLARGSAYTDAARDQRLGVETRAIVVAVDDLERHTIGVAPDDKPVPPIHDVDSYVALRLDYQIDHYYRCKAAQYETRVRRFRQLGDLLGITAVLLAASAAAFHVEGLAAWVPVATTIGTAVAAHVAAARYDLSSSSSYALHSAWNIYATSSSTDRWINLPSSTPAKPPSRLKTRRGWRAGTLLPLPMDRPGHGPLLPQPQR